MRFFDSNSVLALLPPEPAVSEQAMARLNPLLARHGGDHGRLPDLTAKGELKPMQINYAGEPVAVAWVRTERERLIVDTLVALETGRSIGEAWEQIWAGVEQVAQSLGCKSVEGVTARSALARVYLRHGFEVKGVLMRKELHHG